MAKPAVVRKGESVAMNFDWSRVEQDSATTLASSTWESDNNAVSLSNVSTSGSKSLVTVTSSQTGCTTLKNTATMADGQIFVRKLFVELIDEYCDGNSNDGYS